MQCVALKDTPNISAKETYILVRKALPNACTCTNSFANLSAYHHEYSRIHTYIHVYTHIYTHRCIYTYTHVYIYTHTWIQVRAPKSRAANHCTHTDIYRYTRQYTHTYTHTLTHTHTHTRAQEISRTPGVCLKKQRLQTAHAFPQV